MGSYDSSYAYPLTHYLELNGTTGRALIEDTVKRLTIQHVGDETRQVWEAGYFNDLDSGISPHVRSSRRRTDSSVARRGTAAGARERWTARPAVGAGEHRIIRDRTTRLHRADTRVVQQCPLTTAKVIAEQWQRPCHCCPRNDRRTCWRSSRSDAG